MDVKVLASVSVLYALSLLKLHGSFEGLPLQRRIELSTPVTSFYRVKECVALFESGIDPYEGDTCHQSPLSVKLFQYFLKKDDLGVSLFFVVLHTLTGLLLAVGTDYFLIKKVAREQLESDHYKEDAKKIWLTTLDISKTAYLTLGIYYLNPYSIFSCLAFSTGLLTNFLYSFVFFTMSTGNLFLGSVAVGIASYLSFYSCMMLLPVVLHAIYSVKSTRLYYTYLRVAFLSGVALMTTALLLYQSRQLTGSWNFVHATHGFLWSVPDLTPNVGLFWYFFMEMFDHFRAFFLWIFQINVFIYVIPMGLLFRQRPTFLFYILTSLLAIFKSYPEVCDLCIPLALLPLWSYLYRYMRSVFPILCIYLFTSVLGPVLYYLWIYVGSANANFFYAVTLAFGLGQILLVTDMIIAYLKREFHLVRGLEPLTDKGEPGIVVLQ